MERNARQVEKEKSFFRAMKGLSWLTQLGFSLVCPPLLCVFVALKLQERFGLGNWVMIVAILVGILSAACTFISFAKQMLTDARADTAEKVKKEEDNET